MGYLSVVSTFSERIQGSNVYYLKLDTDFFSPVSFQVFPVEICCFDYLYEYRITPKNCFGLSRMTP